MDNLTHTLTGLMLSRAGLDRLTPRAGAILMLAANTPDIDTVTALGGVYTYLDHHRGFTHGLPVLPLMALLPTLAAGLWPRRPAGFSWLYAYLLACIGLASHLLMDWTNVYGIRLLAPISGDWFRLSDYFVQHPAEPVRTGLTLLSGVFLLVRHRRLFHRWNASGVSAPCRAFFFWSVRSRRSGPSVPWRSAFQRPVGRFSFGQG